MKIFLSWACYYIGDIACGILELWDNEYWVAFWYPLYNNMMLSSEYFQGDSPKGPWSKTEYI